MLNRVLRTLAERSVYSHRTDILRTTSICTLPICRTSMCVRKIKLEPRYTENNHGVKQKTYAYPDVETIQEDVKSLVDTMDRRNPLSKDVLDMLLLLPILFKKLKKLDQEFQFNPVRVTRLGEAIRNHAEAIYTYQKKRDLLDYQMLLRTAAANMKRKLQTLDATINDYQSTFIYLVTIAFKSYSFSHGLLLVQLIHQKAHLHLDAPTYSLVFERLLSDSQPSIAYQILVEAEEHGKYQPNLEVYESLFKSVFDFTNTSAKTKKDDIREGIRAYDAIRRRSVEKGLLSKMVTPEELQEMSFAMEKKLSELCDKVTYRLD